MTDICQGDLTGARITYDMFPSFGCMPLPAGRELQSQQWIVPPAGRQQEVVMFVRYHTMPGLTTAARPHGFDNIRRADVHEENDERTNWPVMRQVHCRQRWFPEARIISTRTSRAAARGRRTNPHRGRRRQLGTWIMPWQGPRIQDAATVRSPDNLFASPVLCPGLVIRAQCLGRKTY